MPAEQEPVREEALRLIDDGMCLITSRGQGLHPTDVLSYAMQGGNVVVACPRERLNEVLSTYGVNVNKKRLLT